MNRTMARSGSRRKPKAPTSMAIPTGPEIKKMREDRWISVLELARRSKVTRQAIAAWESGKRTPRFETARKVVDALEKVPVRHVPASGQDDKPKE